MRHRHLLPFTGLALLLCGCTSIRVDSELGAVPQELTLDTWAFDEPAEPADAAVPTDLDAEIRAAIRQEMEALGARQVEPAAADLLIDYATAVEVKVRHGDPYFALYVTEEYEVGTLAIHLVDPASGALVWTGEGTSELRVSAIPLSPFDVNLTPTRTRRHWSIPRKVALILEQLPVSALRAAHSAGFAAGG